MEENGKAKKGDETQRLEKAVIDKIRAASPEEKAKMRKLIQARLLKLEANGKA